MSVNPIIRLAKITSDIDKTQLEIASFESRMEASLLGNTQEDQTQLRLILTQLKALVGFLRTCESAAKDELLASMQDRKSQNDLAKG
jgi:hypothetical protein